MNDSGKSNKINTVSVFTFRCPDPVIADNVRNTIIGSLLTDYSIVIGDEADIIIKGTIVLPDASQKSYISEINVQVIKNNRVLDTAVINQDRTGSSTPDSPEVMGGKAGAEIKKMLSELTL